VDTPRPSPRTNRTRRAPHPVLIGHAACPTARTGFLRDEHRAAWLLFGELQAAQQHLKEAGRWLRRYCSSLGGYVRRCPEAEVHLAEAKWTLAQCLRDDLRFQEALEVAQEVWSPRPRVCLLVGSAILGAGVTIREASVTVVSILTTVLEHSFSPSSLSPPSLSTTRPFSPGGRDAAARAVPRLPDQRRRRRVHWEPAAAHEAGCRCGRGRAV